MPDGKEVPIVTTTFAFCAHLSHGSDTSHSTLPISASRYRSTVAAVIARFCSVIAIIKARAGLATWRAINLPADTASRPSSMESAKAVPISSRVVRLSSRIVIPASSKSRLNAFWRRRNRAATRSPGFHFDQNGPNLNSFFEGAARKKQPFYASLKWQIFRVWG